MTEKIAFSAKQFKFWVAPFNVGGKHMRVSVRFFTTLREITGKREEVLEFSGEKGITVESVLKRVMKVYGKSLTEYISDPKTGEVRAFLQLLVNGRNIASFEGSKTKLTDGDVLAIIPPVGGG
jgi:molybdopterin synthase sulfur carrier subunit